MNRFTNLPKASRESLLRTPPGRSAATVALLTLGMLTAGCGQKADPFQSCITQKTAELKQSDEGKGLDEGALLASAKKACLAAMPTVKEPTITGY